MPVGLTCSLIFATMGATMLIRLIAETGGLKIFEVKHRISWKTSSPDQSVEPAMRVAFIKQPPQPAPLQHQWVTLFWPIQQHYITLKYIFSAVTKNPNVIYLAQEPTLILLTAGLWCFRSALNQNCNLLFICFFFLGNIGTVTEQAMGTTSSVQRARWPKIPSLEKGLKKGGES